MAMATSARVVDAAVRPLLPLASHGFSGRGATILFKKALHFSHLELGSGSAAWRNLAVSAMADNEWEGNTEDPNTEDPYTEAIAATATLEKPADVLGLKRALIDSLAGSQLGLKGTSETRAGIIELINQLEAKNPTPAPTEALQLLDGKWILAYTSFPELFPLFAAGLPLVKVGEISQTIDAQGFTAQNSITFTGPIGYTSFSTSASFEVRSPKRVQIKFEEGIIGTPQLMDAIDIPESFELMGQKIDLTPIKGLLKPLQDAASSVAKTLNGRPPLKFPIQTDKNQSWLLTTYLDNELRISRGDGGNVFVLIREGSELLYSL